jgi:hypothetical protein
LKKISSDLFSSVVVGVSCYLGFPDGFLANLGALRGIGDDDDDCHLSINEPALTILKEEAKALLSQIETAEKDHEPAEK